MGRIFELFYKQRAWEKPNCADYLKSLILPEYASYVNQEKERGGVVNWDDPRIKDTEESMLKDARLAVDKSLKTIEKHGLYDPEAKAEFKLDRRIDDFIVGGRADFILKRSAPYNDLLILDGKGTKYYDKYVHKDQLLWYALLYRETFKQLPDRIGFFFWRRLPDTALQLFDVSAAEVDALRTRIMNTIRLIEALEPQGSGKFLPVLSTHCGFCEYSTGPCTIGTKYIKNCRSADFDLV
jgi:hypothetical protein